jgi:hypothetical protein
MEAGFAVLIMWLSTSAVEVISPRSTGMMWVRSFDPMIALQHPTASFAGRPALSQ